MAKILIKGAQLLELLLGMGRSCGVGELAPLSGLNPGNVHHTLQSWLHLGFVAQDPDSGAYRCTLRLFEWTSRVADGFDVRGVAREHLERLAADTQETIHLSVLDGAEIVQLEKIDSPQSVRAYSKISGRVPAHCVAPAKAPLDHAPVSALAAPPSPLSRPTPNTMADLGILRTQLVQVRDRNYAINHEEWRLGVSGRGATFFDQTSRAIAAVGLSAPSTRLHPANEHVIAMKLVAGANETTKALGLVP